MTLSKVISMLIDFMCGIYYCVRLFLMQYRRLRIAHGIIYYVQVPSTVHRRCRIENVLVLYGELTGDGLSFIIQIVNYLDMPSQMAKRNTLIGFAAFKSSYYF